MRKILIEIVVTFTLILGMLIYKITDVTKPQEVFVTKASSLDITGSIVCSGTIAASRETGLVSKSPIKVTDVFVSQGDTVEAGEVLFYAEPVEDLSFERSIEAIYGGEIHEADVVAVFNSLINGVSSNSKSVSLISVEENLTEVKSPISGIISSLNVSDNSVVGNSVSLVDVLDPSALIVNASVPEKLIKDVFIGMECVVTGSGFEGEYLGKVSAVKPYARQTQTLSGAGETVVDIEISLNSPDSSLLPGFSAEAELICEKINNAVTVPYECITQDENNRELVYVIYDNCAYKRYIETGYELSDTVEIKSGLSHGEQVIISPDENLSNGDLIKVMSDAKP